MSQWPFKLVTCNGCFDGVHPGHMFFLGFCRALGKQLVVGINSDEYILRHKRKNFIPEADRKMRLMDLGFIYAVHIFREETPVEFIRRWRPDVHCIGEEYRDKAVEIGPCKEMGIKIVYVPRIGSWSSSALRGHL